jgi:hypothetical protein
VTPSVQFIPAPATTDPNWSVAATCGVKTSSDREMGLTSIAESGEVDNFNVSGSNPIRRPVSYFYVEILLRVLGSGAYSSVSDFLASTSDRTYAMSVDNEPLVFTSVTEVNASATLLRVRLNCSAFEGQKFWDDLDTGDAYSFTLTYS